MLSTTMFCKLCQRFFGKIAITNIGNTNITTVEVAYGKVFKAHNSHPEQTQKQVSFSFWPPTDRKKLSDSQSVPGRCEAFIVSSQFQGKKKVPSRSWGSPWWNWDKRNKWWTSNHRWDSKNSRAPRWGSSSNWGDKHQISFNKLKRKTT